MPIQALVGVLPKLTYQLYFDHKLDVAIAELDRDIRRTIRATLRTVDSPPPDEYLKNPDSFLDAWGHVKEVCSYSVLLLASKVQTHITQIPPVPFLTSEEEEYLVEQYKVQGFKHSMFYLYHDIYY